MEFLRVIFVIIIASIIGLVLNSFMPNLLEFMDKRFSFHILNEGDTYNMKYPNLSYQGKTLYLSFIGVLGISFLFLSEFNYFFNFGAFLSFMLPSLMLLLRIYTFNNDNISPETGLGYNPTLSWLLSFFALVMGFGMGFSGLYFDNIPKYIPVIIIALDLLSSLIPIFPDKINKYLSYDIRSSKGDWALKKLTVLAISIQLIFFLYFSLFAI